MKGWVLSMAAVASLVVAAGAFADQGRAAPGLHVAAFPPHWDNVRVFRAIILGGASPVSGTPVPGLWLVHLDPGQPETLPGAVVTGAGPFVRLASAACLTPREDSQ
jgi:hypothetical protein